MDGWLPVVENWIMCNGLVFTAHSLEQDQWFFSWLLAIFVFTYKEILFKHLDPTVTKASFAVDSCSNINNSVNFQKLSYTFRPLNDILRTEKKSFSLTQNILHTKWKISIKAGMRQQGLIFEKIILQTICNAECSLKVLGNSLSSLLTNKQNNTQNTVSLICLLCQTYL